jgi:hypothetical protein
MGLDQETMMKTIPVSLIVSILILSGCTYVLEQPVPDRQAEVAAKGSEVMPFDLAKTTHIFEVIENGGRQQVIADEPNDVEQIALIRQHLAEEAERFAAGNFHDPSMIHGEQMPGMHDLVMNADKMRIEYSDLPDGAQILYTTDSADLVDAIHQWFEAQLADHGNHAADHR